jgi:WbqC-like protein family
VKTLVVLQPGYLPWLGYFDLLSKADVFVHYDDVQFDKHGWRNRNRVKGPKGAIWLTVPVLHHGRGGQSILEVEIDDRRDWRRKHLSTIGQLYAHAPFADAILPRLREIIERPWPRLVDLDLALIDWLAAEIGISTPCYRASQLDIGGDRIERLVNLCKYFGASRYISGNAARDYLDVTRFAAAGIEVVWHDYAHPTYAQQHGKFVPYLSVLDLVLNAGARSLSVLSQPAATSDVDAERAELR